MGEEVLIWAHPGVVMEVGQATFKAIIGENIEPEKFAFEEVPRGEQWAIQPGSHFEWVCTQVTSASGQVSRVFRIRNMERQANVVMAPGPNPDEV